VYEIGEHGNGAMVWCAVLCFPAVFACPRFRSISSMYRVLNGCSGLVGSRSTARRTVIGGQLCRSLQSSVGDSKNERQGFGSFHSEDIEELIRQDACTYKSPAHYDDIRQATSDNILRIQDSTNNFQFGHQLAQKLYLIDPNFTFINHGAFGASTRIALQESNMWRDLCESQPLRYFDRILLPMVAHVIRRVSKEVFNCPATELVPLLNVTTGLNAVVSSIGPMLSKDDEVVCLSITYGSTKKILSRLCAETGARMIIVPLPLPIVSKALLLETVAKHLSVRTKLVILDTITSNTALVLPIVEAASLVKRMSPQAVVVADGAHSMFAQNISIYDNKSGDSKIRSSEDVQLADVVDVYITNGHKWFSCPKGTAFMWVAPRMHSMFRPAIVSHGFIASTSNKNNENRNIAVGEYAEVGKLLSGFAWDGCRDYNALLTVPSQLDFWKLFDNICSGTSRGGSRQQMSTVLSGAVEYLTKAWKVDTNRYVGPADMTRGSPMILVSCFLSRSMQ
jgi:isopenicillin-N epimerase